MMFARVAVIAVLAGWPLAAVHAQQQDTSATNGFVANTEVVRKVEEQLAARGYPVTPDGRYDADLRNNVIRYQSEAGLRPTGNVDLDTIGALGIHLRPTDQTAVASPAPIRQPPAAPQMAQLPPSYRYPLLRDEFMSAPQTPGQAAPVEDALGLTVQPSEIPNVQQLSQGETAPGFPPGYPVQDLF